VTALAKQAPESDEQARAALLRETNMQTDLRNEQDELEQVCAALTEITADKQRETQERTAERLSAQASLQKQEEDFEQARQVLGEQFAHQLKLSEDATAHQLSRLQVSALN
jgi:hypothetical protein